MDLAQSSHIPRQGQKPGLGDLPWLALYSLRAFVELVRARLILARLETKEILARNAASTHGANSAARPSERLLARMAYVMPRLSDRLPWRSDCLIQAIAAQNWLAAKQAESEIQIGVENPKNGDFGAHAWLVHDGMVITGGDIDRYDLLLGDSRKGPKSEPK